jgi:hypothetical protein
MQLKHRRAVYNLIDDRYNELWRLRSKGRVSDEEFNEWREIRDDFHRDWVVQAKFEGRKA